MTMVGMDGRMPQTSPDERAVDRERGDERDGERECEGGPEERIAQAGVHRPGHGQHDGGVDDLHHRDRERVRGEREREGFPEPEPRAEQRHQSQRVAEPEREENGECDRRRVAEPCSRADHQADHLADRAPGEAVERRRGCGPVERVDMRAASRPALRMLGCSCHHYTL
jgi:hypothetical protein